MKAGHEMLLEQISMLVHTHVQRCSAEGEADRGAFEALGALQAAAHLMRAFTSPLQVSKANFISTMLVREVKGYLLNPKFLN